ncbi:hypothetical protein F9K33_13760 [bacterium]|nr:MAG: hypothetical protein F9K33_13760 [bacterium]
MKKISRFDFFKLFIVLFTTLSISKWVIACSESKNESDGGDNGGGPTPQPDCLNAGTNVAIGGNHGHQLTVSKAAVAAAVEETYDITGSAGHTHFVTITAADFANLAANQQIVKTSSASGHTHSVTVSCALA